MTFTKLAVRAAAALTLVAFATPALPCGDMHEQTHASVQPAPAAPKATASPTATPKDAIAKQEKGKKAKKTTAAN